MSEPFTLGKARVRRRRFLGAVTDTEVAVLCADEGGLVLDDHRIERGAMTEAAVLPISGGVRVRVRAHGEGQFDILVSDVAEGRALLRALRLDPSRVMASYPISTTAVSGGCIAMTIPIALMVLSVFAAAGLALHFHSSVPWLLSFTTLIAVIAFLASPAKLTIGGDGVRVSWWGRGQFIPHGQIERVVVYDRTEEGTEGPVRHIGVTIQGTQTVDIPMRDYGRRRELAELIAERILEAPRATPAGAAAVSALARGQRPVRAWIDHLRAIGAGANLDARVAALSAEHIGAVLDDPEQPLKIRVAAAIALVAQADEAAPARIREVAQTCVQPKLRIALEAATDPGREAELMALLDEAGGEEQRHEV